MTPRSFPTQIWETSALEICQVGFGPHVADFWQTWSTSDTLGRHRPDVGRTRPPDPLSKCAQLSSKRARHRSSSPRFGRHRPEGGRDGMSLASMGKLWSTSAQTYGGTRLRFGEHLPKLGRRWPAFSELGLDSVVIGTQLWPNSHNIGRARWSKPTPTWSIWPKLGQPRLSRHRPRFGRYRPGVGQHQAGLTSAKCWANSVQIRSTFENYCRTRFPCCSNPAPASGVGPQIWSEGLQLWSAWANLLGERRATIHELVPVGSLHSKACGAMGASDGVIRSEVSDEVTHSPALPSRAQLWAVG